LARFDEHIQQANQNLQFLEFVNQSDSYYDWQVTTCFYTALHLVNAHLSLFNMQYRKHVDVKDAINPKNAQSVANGTSLPETEYLAYMKLQSLSRRSRYLVNEKDGNISSQQAFITYDVHLSKSLKHLNTLIDFFNRRHNISLNKIKVSCLGVKKEDLVFSK